MQVTIIIFVYTCLGFIYTEIKSYGLRFLCKIIIILVEVKFLKESSFVCELRRDIEKVIPYYLPIIMAEPYPCVINDDLFDFLRLPIVINENRPD